jgi:hypothetical protein
MRCETPKSLLRVSILLILVSLLGGCHLERGKLYFDELGLDPITVYQMAPLEKTVFCLAEARDKTVDNFASLYNNALAGVESNPKSDWSELVCLSLSSQAEPSQLAQTIQVLDRIQEAQPQQAHPVAGFQGLMQERLVRHAKLDGLLSKLQEADRQERENYQNYEQELERFRAVIREQNKKIPQLEQQVRELKEIELLLYPKQ